MLLRLLLFVCLISFSFGLLAQDIPVKLGDETVIIHTIENGEGKIFLHVHQNEITALKAAKAVLSKENGKIITLKHSGGRNITFNLKGKKYEFDPNRMFTNVGIRKSLRQFGPYNSDAHREVKKLAEQLKRMLPPGKVIAIHNNRGYSLKDYLPGHTLAKDAKLLNYAPRSSFRNFFLVTKEHDYIRLKKLRFNSILQSSQAEDDGSLSVYLAKSEYVNVEAGYDQLAQQIKMLQHA